MAIQYCDPSRCGNNMIVHLYFNNRDYDKFSIIVISLPLLFTF